MPPGQLRLGSRRPGNDLGNQPCHGRRWAACVELGRVAALLVVQLCQPFEGHGRQVAPHAGLGTVASFMATASRCVLVVGVVVAVIRVLGGCRWGRSLAGLPGRVVVLAGAYLPPVEDGLHLWVFPGLLC